MKTMKSFIFRNIYTWIMFWCLGLSSLAQTTTYPVQVYTQLTPPYTPYAPSYYSGGVEKMRLTLINSDMQQPLLDVYLKMKITSSSFSMQTPPEVRTPSVTLQAGVPAILSMTDLEPYFRKENLSISGGQSQFYRTQMLPDNFYRFHFEVYEVNTNRLLSNVKVGFAQVMIAAGDPPVLNLPLKGSVIEESNIPNIMFTWAPRHMSSVAAAYGTEYEISLVEIYNKQTSAENAFQYSRVLHSERTRATTFIYNSAHPILQPGMRYAWRVQAIAKEGLEDAQVFKNNGYSEIFWFDYKGNCPVVTTSGVITQGMEATVSWEPTQAIDYILEYRKKDGSKWYNANVSGTSSALYSLQPGETYEYRIGSRCYPNDLYDYNDIKAFTMPIRPERSPNCGIMPDGNITNRTLIAQLIPGQPVFAGDFPIFITEVNGNGTFSGTGYVGIPFAKLPRVTVTFSNITVNSDHQLISGFFETKYDIKNNNMLWDADKTVTGGGGVSDIRTGEERAQFVVNYTINPNIKVKPLVDDRTPEEIEADKPYNFTKNENGKYVIILTDADNNEHKIETDKLPVTIADNGGEGEDSKTYQIDEQGNMTLVSSGSKIKLDPATSYKVGTKVVSVEFVEIDATQYAVDQYKNIYHDVTEYYQQYKAGDKEIAASAKFMLPGTSDKFGVKVITSEAGFDPQKVHFVTLAGKEYQAPYKDNLEQWEITVVASDAGDGQELFVVYEETPGKYATIALINIYTYEPKDIKVKLVPVNNNNQSIDLNKVKQIYKKVGITVDIDVAGNFDYPELEGQKLQVTGSGLFSTLTSDMKALESAYSEHLGDDYDGSTYYLFMLDAADAKDKQAPNGDMPRGKQFGYLFNGAEAETVAHELGHGVFNLEHPFARPAGQKSFRENALIDNLMHYHNGTNLAKLQWDQTRAPGLVIGLFERDKDGMAAIVTQNSLKKLEQYRNADNSYTFITPANKPITIKEELAEVWFTTMEDSWTGGDTYKVLGSLLGFKLANGEKYIAAKRSGSDEFVGYVLQENTNKYYTENISVQKKYSNVLVGIPCIVNKSIVFKILPVSSSYLSSTFTSISFKSVKAENRGEGTIKNTFLLDSAIPQSVDQSNSVEVYATMKDLENLNNSQLSFLSSFSNDICGEDILYVLGILEVLKGEEGISLDCIVLADNQSKLDNRWDEIKKGAERDPYYLPTEEHPNIPKAPIILELEELRKKNDQPKSDYAKIYNYLSSWKNSYSTILKSTDLTEATISQFLDLIDDIDDAGQNCILRSLSFPARASLLKKHNEWKISTSKEDLLVKLISTTDDKQAMLDLLHGSLSSLGDRDFRLYWDLYNEINGDNAVRYINEIAMMLKDTGHEPADKKPESHAIITVSKSGIFWSGQRYVASETNDGYLKFRKAEGTGEKLFSPYEYVCVKFESDFRFIDITSKESSQIKAGSYAIVPAGWIYGIAHRQNTIFTQNVIRGVIDVVVIVASWGTATPIVVIDASVATIDLVVTIAEDPIYSSENEMFKQLVTAWDVTAGSWGAGLILRSGSKLIFNFSKTKEAVRGNWQKLMTHIDDFRTAIAELKAIKGSDAVVQVAEECLYNIELQSKLTSASECFVNVSQGRKVAVELRGKNPQYIGTVVGDAKSNITGMDDITWYSRASHGEIERSAGVFDNIEYMPQGGKQRIQGDLEVVVARNGSIYLRVAEDFDGVPLNFFENVNDLNATIGQYQKISKTLRGEIYNYYRQQKWDKIEALFKEHKLNDMWPPSNGGYNIVDDVAITKGMKFDRYQDWFRLNAEGNPTLAGRFCSPIKGNSYNYTNRALKFAESENALYYEIEILKDLPIKGQKATVIPWFGAEGGAEQMMFKFQSKGGQWTSLDDLVNQGYIKITIKRSPNGKYTNWVNRSFGVDDVVSNTNDWNILEKSLRSKLSTLHLHSNSSEANKFINKIVSELRSQGDVGIDIANKIASGKYDDIAGFTVLVNKLNSSGFSNAAKQALNKADEFLSKGYAKSRMIFEPDNLGAGVDIDFAIRRNSGNGFEFAYQFKMTETANSTFNAISKPKNISQAGNFQNADNVIFELQMQSGSINDVINRDGFINLINKIKEDYPHLNINIIDSYGISKLY